MAKPVKRNRKPIAKVDFSDFKEGIYLDDVAFGNVYPLMKRKSDFSEDVEEFVFEGKLHHGEIRFLTGDGLAVALPEVEGYNHGYTLEGDAVHLFKVENALDIYSDNEKRTFNYTKKDSRLIFVGDSKKDYVLFVRFYENCYGDFNNRWAVIFAEEKKN